MQESIGNVSLRILEQLGECPSVPFYEDEVSGYIQNFLQSLNLIYEIDRYGNILVRIPGSSADTRPIAFVAHMDHPGFEAVTNEQKDLIVRPLGGVPKICFTQPHTPVLARDLAGSWIPCQLTNDDIATDSTRLFLQVDNPSAFGASIPVVLNLPSFISSDSRLHMRACDDLAGCATILALLQVLATSSTPGDVFGVFTRAEEVGLTGASLLASCGALPKDCMVVSIESSRELPGAIINQGPVIRVGDASSTFSFTPEQLMREAATQLVAEDPSFQTQRQLMSGGTCEATAFIVHGYAASGLAFPLANYHNSMPDGQIGPESISISDLDNAAKLILRTTHLISRDLSFPIFNRLQNPPADIGARLENSRNRLTISKKSI